ncbi:hypothetical protein AAMO2058_000890400 [Amorphochlora amoebiformis]
MLDTPDKKAAIRTAVRNHGNLIPPPPFPSLLLGPLSNNESLVPPPPFPPLLLPNLQEFKNTLKTSRIRSRRRRGTAIRCKTRRVITTVEAKSKIHQVSPVLETSTSMELSDTDEKTENAENSVDSDNDQFSSFNINMDGEEFLPPMLDIPKEVNKKLVQEQVKRGPQSERGHNIKPGPCLAKVAEKILSKEKKHCGEFAVFYHSYSGAWILYELHTAIANVVLGVKNNQPLPRLLMKPYNTIPNAHYLRHLHQTVFSRTDHNPQFRQAAICATSNFILTDSEATPNSVFSNGYHVGPISTILKSVLKSTKLECLYEQLIGLCIHYGETNCFSYHGLSNTPVSTYKKFENALKIKPEIKKVVTPSSQKGRLLQIFIRRDICKHFLYTSEAMGKPCPQRKCVDKFINQNGRIVGQVRICVNPRVFSRQDLVKIYTYGANENTNKFRDSFQRDLQRLVRSVLSDEKKVKATRKAILSQISGGHRASKKPKGYKMQYVCHRIENIAYTVSTPPTHDKCCTII